MISGVLGSHSSTFPCLLGTKCGYRDRQAARKKIYAVKLESLSVSWTYTPLFPVIHIIETLWTVPNFCLSNQNPSLVSVFLGHTGIGVLDQSVVKYVRRKTVQNRQKIETKVDLWLPMARRCGECDNWGLWQRALNIFLGNKNVLKLIIVMVNEILWAWAKSIEL